MGEQRQTPIVDARAALQRLAARAADPHALVAADDHLVLAAALDELELLRTAKVQRLEFRPGDVVAIECPRPLSPTQASAIASAWRERFAGTTAVVLDSGLHVSAVMRPSACSLYADGKCEATGAGCRPTGDCMEATRG